jgi:glutathione S-transferase
MPDAAANRLITIPFSHYCERARWALDHTRIPYTEEGHLPGVHVPAMRRAGGKTVPILLTPTATLFESADIVRFADEHAPAARKLYPEDGEARRAVEEIETLCGQELGKATRLVAYHHILPHAGSLLEAVKVGMTRTQIFFFPLVVPLVRPLIRRQYRVTEERAAAALETTRRIFGEVGDRLGDKRYLAGDRFSAADLTFASLGAPVLLPEGHPAFGGSIDILPRGFRQAIEEMRKTRAGVHALRLYREERVSRGS